MLHNAAMLGPSHPTQMHGELATMKRPYDYGALILELPPRTQTQVEEGTRLRGFTRFYRFNLLPNHTRFNLAPTKPGLTQTINCAFGPNLLKPGKTE